MREDALAAAVREVSNGARTWRESGLKKGSDVA